MKYESNPEHPVFNAKSQAVLKMASSSAMLYDFMIPFDALSARVLPASRLARGSSLHHADLGNMNLEILLFDELHQSLAFFVSIQLSGICLNGE